MDPIGHWALGALCGLIITLPFVTDRQVYHYQAQRWLSVRWARTHGTLDQRYIRTRRGRERVAPITHALAPTLRSRAMVIAPVVAIVCGCVSALPDIGYLWGARLDHTWWAYLCFAHPLFDSGGLIGAVVPTPILLGLLLLLGLTIELVSWSAVAVSPTI